MQDNNPERRNLVVLSYTFIAVGLGDAIAIDGNISLNLITVKFQNINALIIIAWLTLFWFLFRYWLTHRSVFSNELRKELKTYLHSKLIRDYFRRRIGNEAIEEFSNTNTKDESGYNLELLSAENFREGMRINWTGIIKAQRNETTKKISSHAFQALADEDGNLTKSSSLLMNDLRGRWITDRLVIHCFFNHPSFSSFVIPYILFFLAVGLCLPKTLTYFIQQ